MKLKPLPKAILILAVVAGVGFAANTMLKNKAAEPTADAVAAPTVTTVTPPAPNATPAPAPVAEAPAPQEPTRNVSTGDAGLSAVLGAGKK